MVEYVRTPAGLSSGGRPRGAATLADLIVPPLALVGGVAFGVWRLPQQELFVSLRGPCPGCGVEQSYGLRGVVYRLPQSLKCHACLQLLTLAEASGSAPDRTMNPQR